jgi:hypothetical protein
LSLTKHGALNLIQFPEDQRQPAFEWQRALGVVRHLLESQKLYRLTLSQARRAATNMSGSCFEPVRGRSQINGVPIEKTCIFLVFFALCSPDF